MARSRPASAPPSKPPYRVPPIAEIRRLRPNGYTVASTFSGCGGSCLGFKMAGFRHVFASEFIDAARETYAANFPGVHVDGRDIRQVTAEDVLKIAGMKPGELDVLEGSPPCASFSTAGKRSKGWGQVKKYSDKAQRTDDLFFEFARLLRGLAPRAFVAENVSGLVKGVAKGYFFDILHELKACGYVVECRVIDAQWLGVPQQRQRTIFVGVRDDLGAVPAFPRPLPYRYTIRDAIGRLGRVRAGKPGYAQKASWTADEAAPTVIAGGIAGGNMHQTLVVPDGDAPNIEKYAIGAEWKKLKPGQTSDRFFNLVRPDPDAPVPTVTQLGGANAGVAGVTHPSEPRKFSIAELRRLCGFPDDFILTGTYAQQWERLGRAVPPVMMFHVAKTLRDEVMAKAKR